MMNFGRKFLVLLCCCLFSTSYTYSQDVRYYKLVRKEVNGVSDASVKGGLFITFTMNLCFESDNQGVGINHGVMKLNKNSSNDVYLIYSGSQYWGKFTIFKFKSDKSTLNVIFDDGETYVYHQATAPNGVTKSSQIRKKQQNGSVNTNVHNSPPILGPQNFGQTGTQTGGNVVTYYESVYVDVPCPHCHNSGKCQSCNGSGWIEDMFGSGKIKCPNCYGGNQSGKCNWCQGKGTVKDRQTVTKTR